MYGTYELFVEDLEQCLVSSPYFTSVLRIVRHHQSRYVNGLQELRRLRVIRERLSVQDRPMGMELIKVHLNQGVS